MCRITYNYVTTTSVTDKVKSWTMKRRKAVSSSPTVKKPRFIFSSAIHEDYDNTPDVSSISSNSDGDVGTVVNSERCKTTSVEVLEDSDSLPSIDLNTNHCEVKKLNLASNSGSLEDGTSDDEVTFYENDSNMPIYRILNYGIRTRDVVSILLQKHDEKRIAKNIPYNINKNVSFIYSIEKIGHLKIALCDGMGRWNQMGTETSNVVIDDCNDIKLSKYSDQGDSDLKVLRRKYINSSCNSLHRIVITLEKNDVMLDQIFVQYYFIGDEREVHVNSHGSTLKTDAYKRTTETTKEIIKKLSSCNKITKDIFNTLIENNGGLEHVKSQNDLARNRRQVSYFKSTNSANSDSVMECSDLAKNDDRSKDRFVREVRSAPEFYIFLASDRQLHEFEKYCTNVNNFSVLGVDTTCNIGKFYMTITTYRHLMFLTENSKVEPVMIGPIYQRKSFDSYFKLPSSMLQEKPGLRKIKVFGTDGDVSLSQAFQVCYTEASHLLCDLHMRDNIKKKLSSLGIVGKTQQTIITDIFGVVKGELREPGLVDCNSSDQFDERLRSLEEKWENLANNISGFTKYFKEHKAMLIKACMTAELRAKCGLGYPPQPYTQNANECINAVIKTDIKNAATSKQCDIDPYECVKIIQKVVRRQVN